MKSFRLQRVLALLVFLACVSFTIAQDQPDQPATTYTFRAINFAGASLTRATGINNTGEIVGFYTGAGCTQGSCGFTDVKTTYTSVECVLYDATDIFDISNKGEIVGAYATNDGGAVVGFIYEGASSCDPVFDPLSNLVTEAWGVNDNGAIVGFYSVAAGYEGFLLSPKGVYSTISCAGAISTRAYGINDNGAIVGDYQDSASVYHGFLYKSGKCTAINYPKASATYARGINKSGQITGFYGDSSGVIHGFTLVGTTFTLVDYPSAADTYLYHLNDQGQIAGFYVDTSNVNHGLLASPNK